MDSNPVKGHCAQISIIWPIVMLFTEKVALKPPPCNNLTTYLFKNSLKNPFSTLLVAYLECTKIKLQKWWRGNPYYLMHSSFQICQFGEKPELWDLRSLIKFLPTSFRNFCWVHAWSGSWIIYLHCLTNLQFNV